MIIALVPIERSIPGFNDLADSIRRTFKARITTKMIDLPLTRSFRKKRNQFDANLLLKELLSYAHLGADKVVFLFREDLFADELAFVFGLANQQFCIVSTARLDPRYYGEKDMEKARGLFKKRLLKEVVHELGHTMGLAHCRNKGCAMVHANSVSDVDLKGESLCSSCSKSLSLDK